MRPSIESEVRNGPSRLIRRRLALLSSICVAMVLATRAGAETRGLSLKQFVHTSWALQAGAPSEITALAQTPDGYLWLGTLNGLFRFDGVAFEPFQPVGGRRFRQTAVTSLATTADGGLWVGFQFGDIDFIKKGVLYEQRFYKGYPGSTIYGIVADHDGSTWAAGIAGVIRLVNGIWEPAVETNGLDIRSCYSLAQDDRGDLWLATDDFYYRLRRGGAHFEKTEIRAGIGSVIRSQAGGTYWVTDQDGVTGHSQTAVRHLTWTPHARLTDTTSLLFDRSGALWVGGLGSGITRIARLDAALNESPSAALVEHFSKSDGLTSDVVLTSLEDNEGNIWVATSAGLDRFRRSVFTPAPLPSTIDGFAIAARADGTLLVGTQYDGLQELSGEGLTKIPNVPFKFVINIYSAPDGKLWLGGKGELGYLERGLFHRVALPVDLVSPPRDTQAIVTGPDGDIWFEVSASGQSLLKLHQGRWSPILKSRPPIALTLVNDNAGRVWGGYLNGVVRVFDRDGKITKIDKAGGITVGNVTAFYDCGTYMWIGGEHGVDLMISGRPIQMRFSGDASIDGVSGIMKGNDGAFWLNTLSGVARVPSDEVARVLSDPDYRVQYALFNYLDGLSAKAPQMRPLPSVVKGAGNTLWFTTTSGAFSIDTSMIYRNSLPPPVTVSTVTVDGIRMDPRGAIVLPKGAQSLQLNYTALSLAIPERVLFRYRLDGYDQHWQEAGTRRQALYSHLPPGHYTFHVIACNDDGVWNQVGASLSIDLPPSFLQSWYFKILMVVAALIVLRVLVLARSRRETAKMQTRLAERFNERQRIARDLHDTFFQGVQGLLLHVQSATRRLGDNDPVRRDLERTLQESDAVMLQGRELLLNLRATATDVTELPTRLRSSAIEFAHLHPVEFDLEITGRPAPLEPTVCDELSKLGREALCNAYQHAKANKIDVQLSYRSDTLVLAICDDGVGIPSQILFDGGLANHWGIQGMKERAAAIGASLDISSAPGKGTLIKVTIPAGLSYRYTGTIR